MVVVDVVVVVVVVVNGDGDEDEDPAARRARPAYFPDEPCPLPVR